jgi:hypothetical protein
MDRLARLGVDMEGVYQALEDRGVAGFRRAVRAPSDCSARGNAPPWITEEDRPPPDTSHAGVLVAASRKGMKR